MNFTKVFQLRSIRRKLILLVSLLTILPAGILAGLTLHFHQQNFFSIEYIPIQQAAVVFKRNILLSLPAITIPAMIIGWLLLQGFTSSLQKIISGSGKSVQGDRLHRIELPSGDDAGKIAHALHTVTTELQETIASKKYAENIIQSMDDSLVVTSPDFTIRIANQSTCDLLGYNAEELTGKPIDILFCEKDTSPAPWFDFIEKDLLRKTEKTYLSKDGRKIPVLFSCNAIRGNNGNIAGIVCVALDITERKRIEADLKKAVSQKDENIKDMGYLMYFSTLMNEEVREDKLIHHMVKALQEHFQPELLAVLTIDKTKNVFDTTHMSPPIPLNKLIKPEVIADPSLCQVIRTGREIIVGNIDKDIPCECIIHKIEGGGYACLPLITEIGRAHV